MKKIFGIMIAFTMLVVLGLNVSAEKISSENSENQINSIVASISPTQQWVVGAQEARWTITASTTAGNPPITYTLSPGDGAKPYSYTSFSTTSPTFAHRYNPSTNLKTFTVLGRAIYDYGMYDAYATVYWSR